MKKLLALLLALMMVFSLCACSGSEEPADDDDEKEATEEKKEEDTEKEDDTGKKDSETPQTPAGTGAEMVDVWVIEGINHASENAVEFVYDKEYNLKTVKAQTTDEEGDDPVYMEMYLEFNNAGKIMTEVLYGYLPAEDYRGGTVGEQYAYDKFGNQIETDARYTYDDKGRIITKEYSDVTYWYTISYTYDEAGKLVSEEKIDDYGSYITTYTYDTKGNLIKEESTSGTITYTYDTEGKKLTYQSSFGDGSWKETYEYDANGELVKMNIVAEYMFSGEQIIAFEYKKVTVSKEQAAAIEEQKAYVYENIFTMFW